MTILKTKTIKDCEPQNHGEPWVVHPGVSPMTDTADTVPSRWFLVAK